jgi:indolepyruvate ferredoxin oxidoreductase, beta subunit
MSVTNVLFVGVGGQGIILASKTLAQAAFLQGLAVKDSELHGMAQRGGSVISHVRYGSEVYSPLIGVGQADFLVALEELEGLRNIHYARPGARIILNQRRIPPATVNDANPYPEDVQKQLEALGFKVDVIDGPETAKEIGNPKVENIIILGALSSYLDIPVKAIKEAVSGAVPGKTIEINLAAFDRGRQKTSRS